MRSPLGHDVSLKIHTDPAMWVAGVRALMLQALHPVAIHGVWQNSDFENDPMGRLWRTADYVGVQTAGTPQEAAEAGRRLRALHARLRFTDPATGRVHRVDEPDLLRWVHCAEVGSFLEVTRRAGLRVTPAEADRYLAEQSISARHVGLNDAPASVPALRAYFRTQRPLLRLTPEAKAACTFLLRPHLTGTWRTLLPAWVPLATLAYQCLPPWAHRSYTLIPCPPAPLTTLALRTFRRAGLLIPLTFRDRTTAPRALSHTLIDQAPSGVVEGRIR
ncbi:hypothetical protein GCM10027589_42890 [Actinocorallia lasiicapitis]